jgi:hypothetical protein
MNGQKSMPTLLKLGTLRKFSEDEPQVNPDEVDPFWSTPEGQEIWPDKKKN